MSSPIRQNLSFLLIVSSLFLLAACSSGGLSEEDVATRVAETQSAGALETAAAINRENFGDFDGEDQSNRASGSESDVNSTPIDTPTPSETPTATTVPIPYISVSTDTNCRSGPAVFFDYIGTAFENEEYEVIGTWDIGTEYVIIRLTNGRSCWLWTRYADQTDFAGFGLQQYTSPPTPTPTFTPKPSGSIAMAGYIDDNPTGQFSGSDYLIDGTASISQGACPFSGSFDSIEVSGGVAVFPNLAEGTYCVGFNPKTPPFCLVQGKSLSPTTSNPRTISIGPGENRNSASDYIGFICQ